MSRSKSSLLFASFLICFLMACSVLGNSPAATAVPTRTLPVKPDNTETAVAGRPATAVTIAATDRPADSPTFSPTAVSPATATPTVDPFPTVNPWDGALLNWIPAGRFIMGANPGSTDFWGAEAPAHTVMLDAFVMYRHEVTNAMYQACVKAAACSSPRTYSSPSAGLYFTNSSFNDYPVIYVTHGEAAAYCEWVGGRLPSEAEWEKAARGEDGRLYPWGNDPLDETRANFCGQDCPHDSANADLDDGYPDLAPVGSFPAGASPYGVMDMAGNVLEWTADWYQADYYAVSPAENPEGPASGSKHPIRGGSWFNDQSGLRTAARASMNSGDAADTLGFRCALPADVSQWRGLPTTPTPRPTPENLPAFNPIDRAELAFVPAGKFMMGADPGSPMFWGAEGPAHLVNLDDYLIYKTEVTNGMYLSCVDAGVCAEPVSTTSQTRPKYWGVPQFADYPVIYVSHTAASAYCTWAGGRLPTEAEWEKAARGTDGRLFPWGDERIDFDKANFCLGDCIHMSEEDAKQPGSPDTDRVASYSGVSPYGVYDMAGNVGEWVADRFRADYYSVSPGENPTGPETGDRRVIRGGSWLNDPSALRTVARSSEVPYSTFNTVGFRCVMDVSTAMELPQQVATATAPALAGLADPHLVFVAERDGRPAVYAINPDGSQLTRLTQVDVPEMVADRTPFFLSPDGKRVAFYSNDDSEISSIYVMNVDGSQLTVVREFAHSYAFWPALDDGCKIAWSPNGAYLAFMNGMKTNDWALQLELVDLKKGKTSTSTYTWSDLYYDPFACNSLDWSPDSTHLTFNASLAKDITSSGDGFIVSISLEDPAGDSLSENMELDFMSPASWSPDGKSIAYSRSDGSVVLITEQGDIKKKFNEYLSAPTWSPGGTFLLSACQPGLCRFEPDGEELIVIAASNVSFYEPSWVVSPDGQMIAYVDNDKDLYILSSDGSWKETLLLENVLSYPIWQTSAQTVR
ncbi:MAG: SUMF1/EgtB/PvdO family nonheme iron enzyme [Chloroflexota bacterium]